MTLLHEARRGIVFERAAASALGTVVYGVMMLMTLGLAALPDMQRRKQFRAYEREVVAAVAAARKARKRSAQT